MKKLVLLTACLLFMLCNVVSAADFQPNKKVVLFYRVSDAILQAQNSDEDMIKGKEEFEKELKDHYSKRFIVQEIRRAAGEPSQPPAYQATIKPNQTPFIVKIDLEGEGTSVQNYQNAYGAQATGYAPGVNVHLVEAMPNSAGTEFIPCDYGTKLYSSGTFAVGMGIYAAQTDPRKNTKNAVRGSFRDACKFNDKINKFVNPLAYELEVARYQGNFEKCREIHNKMYGPALDKIKKFEAWCNADATRAPYLGGLNAMTSIDQKMIYINQMEKMGVYKEV